MPENTIYITTNQQLSDLCSRLASAEILAIDTEFVRDRTYFAKLCLIQIATNDVIACIDPLTIEDLSPLLPLLTAPDKTKVFHAARQDLEVLFDTFSVIPSPVFDTQIAAALLGLGEQIGYANLIKHYIKIDIPKGQARTDWEQRPISEAQMVYAANDVRYLLQVYPMMKEQLDSLGRTNWLDDDFQELTDERLYRVQPAKLWQRIAGQQKLRGIQLAVLQKLAIWREELARNQNKPRKWILQDNFLLTIAMQMPSDLKQLSRIRGLNPATIEQQGKNIIKLITETKSIPKAEWPQHPVRYKPDRDQEALLEASLAIIKLQAAQHGISSSALTSKSELEQLICGNHDVQLLHGWRLGIAGQHVMDFLTGKTTLRSINNRLSIIKN